MYVYTYSCVCTYAQVLVRNGDHGHPPPLPYDHTKVTGVAVIGPSGNVTGSDAVSAYCGDYAACERCPDNHTVSIVTGISNYLASANSGATVMAANGCADGRNGTDASGIAQAVALARSPAISHVVLAVGMDGALEGEGNDRLPSRFPNGIGLPGVQQRLVDAVVAVGKPTTVVVIGGGAMPVRAQGPRVAVAYALYPGVETGNALAELLFGETSPSSKLPFTVPVSAAQLPLYTNFSMVARPYGRTFSWIRGNGSQPLYEYGFGLSYSRFSFADLQVHAGSVNAEHPGPITVKVTLMLESDFPTSYL